MKAKGNEIERGQCKFYLVHGFLIIFGILIWSMRQHIGNLHFYIPKLNIQRRSSSISVNQDSGKLIKDQCLITLGQKLSILSILRPEDYGRKAPSVFNSSIGSHVRHSLDHFDCILKPKGSIEKSDETVIVNYDERKRNTNVESDIEAAKSSMAYLSTLLQSIDLNQPITVAFMGNTDTFEHYSIQSTVARELSFVSHHAVHHLSMIKLILKELHYELPSDLAKVGMAASTIKAEKERSTN